MKDIKNQIITTALKFARYKPEQVNEETKFVDDLGYDSVRLVSFVINLEEIFDIEVEDTFLRDLLSSNIKQVIDYFNKK